MRFTLCATPDYLARHPALHHPRDLRTLDFLAFVFPASGRQKTSVLQRGDERFVIDQEPTMRFNSGGAYIAAAEAGLGFVAVPTVEARLPLAEGRLVEILPQWRLESMPMSLVYPYSRRLSARVRAFADWAGEVMGSDPLWRI